MISQHHEKYIVTLTYKTIKTVYTHTIKTITNKPEMTLTPNLKVSNETISLADGVIIFFKKFLNNNNKTCNAHVSTLLGAQGAEDSQFSFDFRNFTC